MLALGLAACTSSDPAALPVVEMEPLPACMLHRGSPVAGAPVLMTLQTREHAMTVYDTRTGLRFTVVTAQGSRVLAEALTVEELEQTFPDLHDHFETALR